MSLHFTIDLAKITSQLVSLSYLFSIANSLEEAQQELDEAKAKLLSLLEEKSTNVQATSHSSLITARYRKSLNPARKYSISYICFGSVTGPLVFYLSKGL